jgi:bifunctional non-homologous end joining protein LigD
MVTADKERPYVGGAFITSQAIRERLMARVNAKAKPLKGVKVKPGAQWLKPGLIGRVRHLKGEQELLHATLQDIREDK